MNSKRNRKKEGFLNVKLSSRSALGKAWKRKWVVVQQNTSSSGKSLLLELYMEKGAYHKTVTSLLLEDVVSVRRTKSKTQEHAIEIASASKTLLGVSADSETETQEWLSMFQMNLLPPVKELPSPPGIPHDFIRVSVIPNKDSERLKLDGDYLAHISLASINLYDTCTGDIALEWDLRHLKKFMLISKCHSLDVEKIVHIFPSKRSPKGEGEFIFFSAKGKQLVEGIYGRLSNAMTVKSRRSRSTSMLFEITPQELEQMLKETEQPLEEEPQETEEEAIAKKEGEVNGDTSEVVPTTKAMETDELDRKDKVESATKTEDSTEEKNDEATEQTDESHQKEDKGDHEEDKSGQAAEVDDAKQNDPEVDDTAVAQQADGVNTASVSQDADMSHSADKDEDETTEERKEQDDDDKANQTNPEEMDACTEADSSRSPGLNADEQNCQDIQGDDTAAANIPVDEVHPKESEAGDSGPESQLITSMNCNKESNEPREDVVENKGLESGSKDDANFQEHSNQDDTIAKEHPVVNDTTSQEHPDQVDTTSQEQPGQVDTTSQEQPDQIDTTSQEQRDQLVDTTSQEQPDQVDTTSQEHSNQDDTTSQEHSNQDDTTSQDHSNQDDTTSQEQPDQVDTTSQEQPDQLVDTTSQEQPDQVDTTSQEHSNQVDTTSQDHSNQGDTTSQEHPNQDDTTSQEHSNQDDTILKEQLPIQKVEESEGSSETREDAGGTSDQCAPVVQTGINIVETSKGDHEPVDVDENLVNDHPGGELNPHLKTDTSSPAPDTETFAENQCDISEQKPPLIDNKSAGSTSEEAEAKNSTESAEPATTGSESSGVSMDDSNPNHNNSNSNESYKRNSKTVPMPNSSRMTETLQNAQERRLSVDKSPTTQETQTAFL